MMKENKKKKNNKKTDNKKANNKKAYMRVTVLEVIFAAVLSLCACGREEEELTLSLSELVEEQSREAAELSGSGLGNDEEAEDSQGNSGGGTNEMLQLSGCEADDKEAQSMQTQELCYVHVCGAVHNPGVVTVPVGSRAETAVKAAGGMTQEADTAYINLAAVVEDGQQLYIPSWEESAELQQQQKVQQAGMVDINKAGIEEFCTLPGIGESRAADIIAYREEHGEFAVIEDIMQVSGIKESAFAKIKDKIIVQ